MEKYSDPEVLSKLLIIFTSMIASSFTYLIFSKATLVDFMIVPLIIVVFISIIIYFAISKNLSIKIGELFESISFGILINFFFLTFDKDRNEYFLSILVIFYILIISTLFLVNYLRTYNKKSDEKLKDSNITLFGHKCSNCNIDYQKYYGEDAKLVFTLVNKENICQNCLEIKKNKTNLF